MTAARTTRPLLVLTRLALRELHRQPVALFVSLFAPAVFLVLLGLLFTPAGSDAVRVGVPGVLSWCVSSAALLGTAVPMAHWRRTGLLADLRGSALGWRGLFGARLLALAVHAGWQVLLLLAVGLAVGFRPTALWPVPLFLLAGTLAFAALGLVVGVLTRSAEHAAAVAVLLLLPMALTTGFLATEGPDWVRAAAQALPTWYLRHGLVDGLTTPDSAVFLRLAALLAYAAVLGLAGTRLCASRDR
ncbi:ABC-2 type transport system permease protein [Crossiella equi]|uniref:ABC-2 type transport system permease protein n=1 Tax=Crossiella equi TaxID=130796 RepID=A0ABS5AJV8_9PSEU|nr:ABC transporter permease [Crossiella equi]MBP2476848.1 ABC-2 type transport system permease protein [Crossiella equi]